MSEDKRGKAPDPKGKPVLDTSRTRDEDDYRSRTSGPTVARRQGKQVIKKKKKQGKG